MHVEELMLLLFAAFISSPGNEIDAPAWVGREAFFCKTDDAVIAYASGSGEGIRNDSLASSTAANRARAGVTRLATGTNAATMINIEVVDFWRDPRDCAVFALARWQDRTRRDAPSCRDVLGR